ncbi:MAG: FHA domain-containing protein [Acidobacteria bacterium]|nr:FHA domain-containing protein [Acidobacteriota bacterium]
MPLIRCPKCGQAYDVPGVVAVRLPNSIATCHCGEWLAGSKAAVLARLLNPEEIKEVDLSPYRVDTAATQSESASSDAPPSAPRSVRVIARGANESLDTVFTIHEHPLWIGRKGCHVELAEAELSIRHCSISVRGRDLVVRDADSHMGTFLDGQEITEAVIDDGIHLLRVGSALVSIEPTAESGVPVQPIALDAGSVVDEHELAKTMRERAAAAEARRTVLVCVEGALAGQEFEVPPGGLVVGREGHVRVPDEFLSRRHFEVAPDADGFIRVRDLGSRNGTFLNTLPARNTKVQKGDEIKAGVNRFRIEQRA